VAVNLRPLSLVLRPWHNPPRPWWRTQWLVVPAVVAAGLALGVGVVAAASRRSCPALVSEGGTIEGVRYLERMRGGASSTDAVPMVILLHSLTGSPEGYASGMNGIGPARLILPEGGYEVGSGSSWFPRGIKTTVQDGNDPAEMEAWRVAGERMARFVDTISHCRPTVGKPVVTGSSQGGEMALLLANEYRRMVAGSVVVNADLPEPLWTRRMAQTIWLHGTGDTTVPYELAKAHADDALDRGQPVTFESFQSPGHELTGALQSAWIAAVRDMVEQVS